VVTVQARGVDLAVREAGTGIPVLWGHGLTSSMAAEDQNGVMTPQVDEERFRLVRYDARGHGGSEGTTDVGDYPYPELAKDQLALADALGLDRFVTGGASLGSGTALHVAVQAPERVLALILMIPPTGWEGRRERAGVYEASGSFVTEHGIDAFIELAEQEPVAPVFEPFAEQIRASVRQRYEPFEPEVLSALLRGVGPSDLPAKDAIAGITVPTLILAWEGDPVHPESTAEVLTELIADTETHVAPSLREVLEWPELIRGFLDRIPDPGGAAR
jgi:pimeloyl-ACP methyl ester carboxylesterase